MTDPVTNVEIEDVLSSIRRLIADAPRNERRPQVEAAAEPLVLTDAHRIAPQAANTPDAEPGAARLDEFWVDRLEPSELEEINAAFANLDGASDTPGAVAQAEPEQAPAQPFAAISRIYPLKPEATAQTGMGEAAAETAPLETPERDETPEETPEEAPEETPALQAEDAAAPEQQPEPETEPETAEEAALAASLEERIAELEDAVGARVEDWEPDGSETRRPQAAFLREVVWDSRETLADAATEAVADAVRESLFETRPSPLDADDLVAFAGDTIEAHEIEEVPEDEGTEDSSEAVAEPVSGPGAEEWAELVARRRRARAEALAVPETPQPPAEDAMLSEEALRELVGTMIRQELRGQLGERITRNVRKLVRREIQQALASRDLL